MPRLPMQVEPGRPRPGRLRRFWKRRTRPTGQRKMQVQRRAGETPALRLPAASKAKSCAVRFSRIAKTKDRETRCRFFFFKQKTAYEIQFKVVANCIMGQAPT